jgi:uncharacterized protein YndB with AHSA1/START domain
MIADRPCAEIRRRLAFAPEKVFAAFAEADLVFARALSRVTTE